MKILHTISSMGVKSGGPALSTLLTVKGLRNYGIEADVVTYQTLNNSDKPISCESFIHMLQSVNNVFAYSKQLKKFLLKNIQYDLYHAQGVWLYPTYITSKIARQFQKSYIITPRGMLYPQDLAKRRLKKTIFLKLFLLNDLQQAACVHATCKEEMIHLRNLGVKSPVALIPNPIETDTINEIKNHSLIRVGYLGRVHPRKNIERIIYAWNKLGSEVQDKELVIIGSGNDKYHQFLKDEVVRMKLKNVVFTGFLSGKEKADAIQSLSYLVVPSDFENFGMIIPEALIRGVPVIASKGTPWEELNTHYCGWWVDNSIDTLTQAIKKAISTSEQERLQMGRNGQKLIKENYSVEIVTGKMLQLYNWILNGGEKPEFVYL
ncbi:GDP-mannose-dependent alpha-mannosyltransferase [termite gut metagenome]|uniref:GDP-mannose-dependent alpha-mannosyltransferase n=1 Tax=termite gut metagenome TaxID=433724 RepID=A0A5J4Q533_9ZZZZ